MKSVNSSPDFGKDELSFQIAFFENLIKDKPDYVEALIPLADAYTKRGWFEKGLEIDRKLAVLCPHDETVFYNLACSYALVGSTDKAFKALTQSIQLGYSDLEHLLHDHDLESLRQDPEFKKLVKMLEGLTGLNS